MTEERHGSAGCEVPAAVQAVLAARIGRLPPEDKQLLQAAAVVGEDRVRYLHS